MIDVEKKIIYLGYGDVKISGNLFSIDFIGMNTAIKPGTCISPLIAGQNIKYVTEPIIINFVNLREVRHFIKLVKEIDNISFTSFEYHDYIFDFTNYNEKSIEVILMYLNMIELSFLLPMAG